ncbi:uncharacterized protein B0J16DRAFT_396516 [Fusarium flagelliforme]|uniref:Uncharacterized protein n=1 Tax=Fusarium flagelliforme TaxID=2675880 RepID=A0A395N072_9HYPO|nr:uncharacterized protein B0J16DRAFT_396516 [Fusarium flagelliforme]KAH7188296.1 hypothetical protein B0J16DRAFT_396516 [Fusarium flagelliforme]RFN52889.1 hypothetical protein FIE12Z_2813 [Fusarium flagelliforme]
MKFFNLITLASLATAVPHVRRQDTVTGTLKNAANFMADDAMTAITQIENAVEALKTANTTTGRAPIQAQNAVKASVQDIADALKAATAEVNRVTTEARGSVGAQAAGFQTQDVVQLTTTLKNVLNTIKEIGATVEAITDSLTPEILATIEAELSALKDSINPLLRPLLLLGVAVRNTANQLVGGVEKSLDSVITNIISFHGVLSKALGLSSLRGL